jgi:hypothetical protein
MAFTTITAETHWNSLALAQEVYQACLHRVGALRAGFSDPNYDPIPEWAEPDTSTRVFDFIKNAQMFVNRVYSWFYDPSEELHGSASPDLTPLDIYKGDPETGKPDDTSPFRRVPEGTLPPTHAQWADYDWEGYSYGAIQQKDVAGPWLWADLFSVIGKLTRIADSGSYTAAVEKREDHSFGQQSASPPPYAALSGSVVLPLVTTYCPFFEVFMRRIEFGGTTAEMTIQMLIVEKEYYSAADVTATNKLVVFPQGGYPGAAFGFAAADMGKTATRDPLSTREENGRHYFRAAFCDPASLIGASRESIISAVVPWGGIGGINSLFTNSSARYMVTDYVFPDGDISASAG